MTALSVATPRTHINLSSLSPLFDHRPFYLVYNHLAHRFAFALVLLYRIGSVVLSHLLLPSAHGLAHGLRLRLSLHAREPGFSSLPISP